MDLRGTLPEEIQGLDNLDGLYLQDNGIQGSIPWMAFNNTYMSESLEESCYDQLFYLQTG